MAFTPRNILRPGADNDPDDLRTARGVLRHAGFFLPEPPAEAGAETGAETGNPGASGRMDGALEAALRRFQRANLLEEDAVMRPFGPTMRRLLDLTERAPAPEARRKVRFQTPIPVEAERRNEELRRAFFRRGTGEDFLDLGRRAMLDDQARAVPELIDLADKIAERDAADGERFRALLLDTAQGISPEAAEAVRMGGTGLARAKGVVRAPATSETAPLLRAAEKAEAPQAPAGPGRLPASPRVTPEGDRARPASPMDRMVAPDQRPDDIRSQTSKPARSPLEASLRNAKNVLWLGRNFNFDMAVENFEHYLSASGEERAWSREESRAFKPLEQAELHNREQFEEAITNGDVEIEKNGEPINVKIAPILTALKDGEPQVAIGKITVQTAPGYFDTWRDRDFAMSLGNVVVGASGDINAYRVGDTFHIRATVEHKWNDPYDFDDEFSESAKVLQTHGKARVYLNRSLWKQTIEGTVRIQNGKLVDPRFVWRDIDPLDSK